MNFIRYIKNYFCNHDWIIVYDSMKNNGSGKSIVPLRDTVFKCIKCGMFHYEHRWAIRAEITVGDLLYNSQENKNNKTIIYEK